MGKAHIVRSMGPLIWNEYKKEPDPYTHRCRTSRHLDFLRTILREPREEGKGEQLSHQLWMPGRFWARGGASDQRRGGGGGVG